MLPSEADDDGQPHPRLVLPSAAAAVTSTGKLREAVAHAVAA